MSKEPSKRLSPAGSLSRRPPGLCRLASPAQALRPAATLGAHWPAGAGRAGTRGGAEPEPAVAGGGRGLARAVAAAAGGGPRWQDRGRPLQPGAPDGARRRPGRRRSPRPRPPRLTARTRAARSRRHPSGPGGARAGPPWGPYSGARPCAWRSCSCSPARPTSASAPWARRAWSSSET